MLNSALCVNASTDNVKKLTELVDKKIEAAKERQKKEGNTMGIDKNCVVYNNPTQMVVGTTFRTHPEYPFIGDRVVYISNNNKKIPFGRTGTVIGTYKLNIEILFDEPFIGGTDLKGRCLPFRGGVAHFHDMFDLSIWINCINRRADILGAIQRFKYPIIDEWDGKIDLMLLINRMNQFKKQFENESFRNKLAKKNALKGKSKPFMMSNAPKIEQTIPAYQKVSHTPQSGEIFYKKVASEKNEPAQEPNLFDALGLGPPINIPAPKVTRVNVADLEKQALAEADEQK